MEILCYESDRSGEALRDSFNIVTQFRLLLGLAIVYGTWA